MVGSHDAISKEQKRETIRLKEDPKYASLFRLRESNQLQRTISNTQIRSDIGGVHQQMFFQLLEDGAALPIKQPLWSTTSWTLARTLQLQFDTSFNESVKVYLGN
jgi:hypothetical protein